MKVLGTRACGALLVVSGALGAAACKPSLPPAEPGDTPSAAEATGRASVPAVDGPSTPLIVDWQPEQRADLEEAIRDGVVVVRFDDKGLSLLKGCHVEGEYGYVGVTNKTQVVRLESAEEVQANLPLSGLSIVGKIGGELQQGATLEIALVMVGKKRTSWKEVTKSDLEGRCDGATHYIRGLTVGAFAMQTGTRQKARAAAEIFGVGAGAGVETTRGVDSSDGRITDCEKASPDSPAPPGQCAALLRIELEPVVAAATAEKEAAAAPSDKPEVKVEEREECPPGMVFLDGKCGKAAADRPHLCKPDDAADCRAQCDKGNAPSCDRLAVLSAQGKAGKPDPSQVDKLFEKACNGGSASACANLGIRYLYGKKDAQRAMTFLERACNDGEPRGCGTAGQALRFGEGGVAKDVQRALRLYTKGCDGGDRFSCTNLAVLYSGAEGIPKDDRKALGLSMRACHGGDAVACGNAGLRWEFGMGVPQDVKQAVRLFELSCRMSPGSCIRLGILHQQGLGVPQDDRKTEELYARTCATGGGNSTVHLACFLNARLFGAPARPLNPAELERTVTVMQPQCDQKVARACSFAGVARLAQGKKPEGDRLLKQACDMKDGWACDLQKRLKGK